MLLETFIWGTIISADSFIYKLIDSLMDPVVSFSKN